jgi:hypothetical protein
MARTPNAGPASPGKGEKVEFENEHVKVVRVITGPRERSPLRTRRDRVLIFLSASHEMHTDRAGHKKEVRHKAGDVLWRTADDHQLENLEDRPVELIVVELKTRA